MDLKDIRLLIKMVDDSNVDEVRIEREDFKITVKKNRGALVNPSQFYPAPSYYPPVNNPAPAPVAQAAPVTASAVPAAPAPPVAAPSTLHEIKSPIVGTYYKSPAPDADEYVKVGDMIKPGDVLCIIEAMKLMNEIESDIAGKLVKIVVENGQPVEYGQVMFLIEPSK
ncbi:MAG: acetyl-CoA carboxylase biotin carboxyl carrier protein [Bacteroidetes bacterium]|nr:acetyl-CoA carboxylase biotin carboxyl carrier protein [Bacteroidota bacterium]